MGLPCLCHMEGSCAAHWNIGARPGWSSSSAMLMLVAANRKERLWCFINVCILTICIQTALNTHPRDRKSEQFVCRTATETCVLPAAGPFLYVLRSNAGLEPGTVNNPAVAWHHCQQKARRTAFLLSHI